MTKKWIYCLCAILAIAIIAFAVVHNALSEPDDPTGPSTSAPTQVPTLATSPPPIADVRLDQGDPERAAVWEELAKA